MLKDPLFNKYIKSKLNEFLEINDNGEVSDCTLWESLKVVMRGYVISYEAQKKKINNDRLLEIQRELTLIEHAYRSSLAQSDYNKILKLKYEYNSILSKCVEISLLKMKHKYFELGDKPERLLARQLKGIKSKQAIHRIKAKSGDLLTDPKQINSCFREFYSNLYSSSLEVNEEDFNIFFDKLVIPQLPEFCKVELDAPILEIELMEAIQAFPSGKSPGPDGFGSEFYKAFSKQLVPYMLRMINDSVRNKKLPRSLYEANIILLLKKGKEDLDPASYRPIALLNFDQKVLTKVMSIRLGNHISKIIHTDQTGFIPGRFSFANTRLLFNILYSDKIKNKEAAIISLDAQKAFDQLEWPYMIEVLKRFGFGDFFISLVKMLYLCPMSTISTNGERSSSFELHRGVRQGDPLSPLLFDLALEPLAIGIRNHPQIHGIKCGDTESLVNLYADDLLIFISDPELSVPNLLNYIDAFSRLSGYSINWSKSEFMCITNNLSPSFLKSLPFKIIDDHFTYMGLKISRNPKHLFKLNFQHMVDKLKANIECWKLLPLSMIGRINAIKMVTLPRFLYLFQNIRIFLPSSFFRQLDSVICSFVWAYKPPRISKRHLQRPTALGGLGLPVFKQYYWAANARALTYWQKGIIDHSLPDGAPLWLSIEAQSLTNTSLPVLLFSMTKPLNRIVGNNFIIKNSLRILNQIKRFLSLSPVSSYTPIAHNHFFVPGQLDNVFLTWREKGLQCIKDFYFDNSFASFTQLKIKYSLPSSHFFRYLQVRHYVQKNIPSFPIKPKESIFYDLLLSPPDTRHLVSKFITALSPSDNTTPLKVGWANELGAAISDDMWEKSLSSIHRCSVNSRYRLIQFKILHRFYFSKTRLNKIYSSVSPLCDWCQTSEGSLSHLIWSCPVLHDYWVGIFHWFSEAFNVDIVPDYKLAIFGYFDSSVSFSSAQQQALLAGMVAAKKVILLSWKSPVAPCFKRWLSEMLFIIQMDRLHCNDTKSYKRFQSVWGVVLNNLDVQIPR